MGIVAAFTHSFVDQALREAKDNLRQEAVKRFTNAGEIGFANAQANKGYHSVTGNLAASTGYAVGINGVPVATRFEGTPEGAAKGKRLALEILSTTTGAALVFVAGMDYALAVESRGKDVITGSTYLIRDLLK